MRLFELDVLRGLAAVSVVIYHYTDRYEKLFSPLVNQKIYFPFGHYGVVLFFIISGFVILLSLEKTNNYQEFIVSRISRLYPAYWICIIITFLFVQLFGLQGRQVSFGDAALNLTMFHGFFGVPHVDGVYWTLMVELKFYIIMLLVFYAGRLKDIKSIGLLLLMFGVVVHLVSSFGTGLVYLRLFKNLFISDYWHLFFSGIIFYKIYQKRFIDLPDILILSFCLFYSFIYFGYEATFFTFIFFIIFGLLVFGFLEKVICKPLIFLGSISYCLYLIHQNVGYIVIRKLNYAGIQPEISIVCAMLVSICLAYIVHIYVEAPSLLFIKKYFKKFSTTDSESTELCNVKSCK